MVNNDPYNQPAFSFKNRLARVLWGVVNVFLFRPSPRVFFGWRNLLLRLFGARIAIGCHIYAKAEIWAPWNLVCEPLATIADGAIIYNPCIVTMGTHSIVSQQAYICGASHDINLPDFPLISAPITLGAYSWVCARATVMPGVELGERAVLALGAVATKSLEPHTVYGGVPAKKIGMRTQH